MLGVSPSAYEEAANVMGAENAATVMHASWSAAVTSIRPAAIFAT